MIVKVMVVRTETWCRVAEVEAASPQEAVAETERKLEGGWDEVFDSCDEGEYVDCVSDTDGYYCDTCNQWVTTAHQCE